ncbi:MAG: hypothetical protein ABIT07_00580 [Ferruginibacter sp.]
MKLAYEINEHKFLSGGGELRELIRSFYCSNTSFGNSDKWPQTLRIAVGIMLDCTFGMYKAWGKVNLQLYNDVSIRPNLVESNSLADERRVLTAWFYPLHLLFLPVQITTGVYD